MAVLLFGDVLQHVLDVLGIRTTEDIPVRVVSAAINTANTLVMLEAQAERANWLLRFGVQLNVASTDDYVVLPNGSTVLDVNGAVAPKCAEGGLMRVKLTSTGQNLKERPLDVWEAEQGIDLAGVGRGVPEHYCVQGVDSSGNNILWLMPMTASDDVAELTYAIGLTPLTAPTQPLGPPEDYRELISQLAIKNCLALDTVDPSRMRNARDNAEQILRCLRATQFTTKRNALINVEGSLR